MGLRSRLPQLLTSRFARHCCWRFSEVKQLFRGGSRQGECFLRIDDPYSYLLVQLIPELMSVCRIKLTPMVIARVSSAYYPEPEMLTTYARADAARLAACFNLTFHDRAVFSAQDIQQGSQLLLAAAQAAEPWPAMIKVFTAFWQSADEMLQQLQALFDMPDNAPQQLRDNSSLLNKRGHYLSATIYYAGEWYWGLDRVHHLERRLCGKSHYFANTQFSIPAGPKDAGKGKVLSLYYSFRSPYSYLLLERLFRFVDYYAIDLQIKPVLPMVMRGLAVPLNKRLYIVLDTKREADCYGIPFGRISDPLGSGVARALAIYTLAESQHHQRKYLLSVGAGVWSEGIDIATDRGLKIVCERTGLDWDECLQVLKNDRWQARVETNRQEMYALGCWGVPTLQLDDVTVWGQDRLWVMEQYVITGLTREAENRIQKG